MLSDMTHTQRHTTVERTQSWIDSTEARRALLDWITIDGPSDVRARAQLASIGWIRGGLSLDDFAEASARIAAFDPDSLLARRLFSIFVDDWIGTEHEHVEFHRHIADADSICSGCWL